MGSKIELLNNIIGSEQMDEIEMLTEKEAKAIRGLEQLAKNWPKSLSLFSHSGTLCVMKFHPGHPEDERGRVVEVISGIDNDGGDPDHKEWDGA